MTSKPSTQLSVVDPTYNFGGLDTTQDDAPPQLDSLSGKVIGLLWNAKPFGDVALQTTRELIEARYEDVEFRFYSGHQPHPQRVLDQVNDEVDAVILCTAD